VKDVLVPAEKSRHEDEVEGQEESRGKMVGMTIVTISK